MAAKKKYKKKKKEKICDITQQTDSERERERERERYYWWVREVNEQPERRSLVAAVMTVVTLSWAVTE